MPIGYRAFRVSASDHEAFLAPANGLNSRETPLEFPLTRAICSRGCDHFAPAEGCSCGYYAYDSLGGASAWESRNEAWIMAEVWGWGEVEVHEYGWKAERLQVLNFFAPVCDHEGGETWERARCHNPATVAWDRHRSFGCYKDAIWPARFSCPKHIPTGTGQLTLGGDTQGAVPVGALLSWLSIKFGAGVFNDRRPPRPTRNTPAGRVGFRRLRAHQRPAGEHKKRCGTG